MKKGISLCLVLLGVFLFWVPSALAISLGFVPASQTAAVGDPVMVDVVISGLGTEIVSAFDLDVTYDLAILDPTAMTFGPHLGDPFFFEAFTDSDLSTPGLVDFAELSLLSDFELDLMQPDSFTLASIYFDVVGPGTSSLDFVFDAFNDIKGLGGAVLQIDPGTGSIGTVPAPEPATMLLLGTGLAGLAGFRRKFKK